MSVFKVQLNNAVQGTLDVVASTTTYGGTQQATSLQRTIYVMGPRKINRELKDGATFSDCNYWKRYARPATAADITAYNAANGTSYSTTVTDAGFAASQVASGPPGTRTVANPSTFLVCINDDGSVWSDDGSENAGQAIVTNVTISPTTVNYLATYGSPANFLEIYNHASGSQTVTVTLNGGTSSFTVAVGGSWIFNHGDVNITSVTVTAAGTGAVSVDLVAGLKVVANS